MKRIAVGLLASVMGGSMLLTGGTASAQSTALTVRIESVTPNPVVVKEGQDTAVTIDVRTTDATRVVLKVQPAGDRLRSLSEDQAKFARQGDLWRFTTAFDEDDPEGRWTAVAEAFDKDNRKLTSEEVNFSVEQQEDQAVSRITRFSTDPESVRKGRTIFYKGRLQVSDDGSWDGLDGEKVSLYFRADGRSIWKWVASTRTDDDGRFFGKIRAKKSGDFKAIFAGDDDVKGSQSRTDHVRVRGGWGRY